MNNLLDLIYSKPTLNIADYFSLYKKLEKNSITDDFKYDKKIKIAILSSFTINGIMETLSIELLKLDTNSEFYISPYNQYHQEVLNKESDFYKFQPDLTIIMIDTKSILGEFYYLPYSFNSNHREKLIKERLNDVVSIVSRIKQTLKSKIILNNFEVPTYSPLGILESKQEFGFIESVEFINYELRAIFKNDNQVFIYDYDAFCSIIGKQNIIDEKMYYLGDLKISLQNIPQLCKGYLSFIKPILSLSKKCIVLDLDNTLWGGIIGEDGLEGIKLGPSYEGKAFWEFQKHLLALNQRGVILAINSKNNLDDVLNIIRNHEYMVLQEDNFASIQANWDDKATNIQRIANEINIGLDSIVFMDDDKLNRELVKGLFPEVIVVDMPDDPSLYVKTLCSIKEFDTLQLTHEDVNKTRLYAEQQKRDNLLLSCIDIDDYLKRLDIQVIIEKHSLNVPRISQLTQKTNQFNLTTKRYLEEEIMELINNSEYLVISAKVIDKYGDYGITGTSIIKKTTNCWEIDTFLLSCRVIGKYVENMLLYYIIKEAKDANVSIIKGQFIKTKKNKPAEFFYKNSGFELIEDQNNIQTWQFNVHKTFLPPEFIQLIER